MSLKPAEAIELGQDLWQHQGEMVALALKQELEVRARDLGGPSRLAWVARERPNVQR
jgi:hypothetical protein